MRGVCEEGRGVRGGCGIGRRDEGICRIKEE